MKRENTCAKIRETLSLLDYSQQPVPPELNEHLASCSECAEEYETRRRMYELIVKSRPATPPLAESVLAQIERENLTPHPPEKTRRHFPVGTLAAAAAVLAVYVSVNHGGLPDMFSGFGAHDTIGFGADDSQIVNDTDGALSESARLASEPSESKAEFKSENGAAVDGSDIAESSADTDFYDIKNGLPDFVYYSDERALGGNVESVESDVEQNSDVNSSSANLYSFGSHAGNAGGGTFLSAAPSPELSDNDAPDDSLDKSFGVESVDTLPTKSPKSPDAADCAKALFDELERVYPDAISLATFEATDPQDYLLFVYTAVEDFDVDYNEKALASYLNDREVSDQTALG